MTAVSQLIVIDGLLADLNWLKENLSLLRDHPEQALAAIPTHTAYPDAYAQFVREHELDPHERLLLLLALAQYLDPVVMQQLVDERNMHRLHQSQKTGLLFPTGETFLQLVAGNNTAKRIAAHHYLNTEHLFYKKSVLDLGEVEDGASLFSGILKLTPTFRELFLYNKHSSPRFSSEFPAHLLTTNLNWDDLVINPSTANRLEEIKAFLDYEKTLRQDWGLSKHLKLGYRCLFHGRSGTGKTLAATLLGKHIGREVYRVDLSSVISKFIGDTSKNLNALFNHAEDKNWILFFDEGDALFGKRVDTSQADDKNAHYANQDIAFLLQRIENFNGLIIVASNFRKNMDDAFSRRFQSIVTFDVLNTELSVAYWKNNFPKQVTLGPGIDFELIVKRQQLSPASIINVISRVCLMTMQKQRTEVSLTDLELCIKDEALK